MESHFIFKKLPLDPYKAEIRLLQLDYDDSTGPVRCSLAVADLADNPIYEAVSYAWGDLVEESIIILNGVACRVSKHLEAFLRSVRSRTSQTLIDDLGSDVNRVAKSELDHLQALSCRTPLWIDALCINQANNEEKGSQVSKMAAIYKNSTFLSVWLGEDDSSSKDALALLHELSDAEAATPLSEGQEKCLNRLFARPWWQRTWVIQELVFGTVGAGYHNEHRHGTAFFRYSSNAIAWPRLCDAISKIYSTEHSNLDYTVVQTLQKAQRRVAYHEKLQAVSLVDLLIEHRSRLSSDPRDKVYALLGLAQGESATSTGLHVSSSYDDIHADYSKDVNELFREITSREIGRTKSLDILWACQRRSSQVTTSWTPDWSLPPLETPLSLSDHAYQFRASEKYPALVSFSTDQLVMRAHGLLYDTITKVGPIMETERGSRLGNTAFMIMTMGIVTEMVDHYAGPNPYDLESLPRAEEPAPTDVHPLRFKVMQTELLANEEWGLENSVELHRESNIGRLQAFWRAFSVGAYSMDPTTSRSESSVIEWADIRFATGRRIFLTEKGLLGLGPPDCRIGDQLTILLGVDFPYLLRLDGDYYELIGETYVESIMNGEVLKNFRLGQVEIQAISIR